MDPKVQRDFNLVKGAIPARIDVSMDGFDDCTKRSSIDRASPWTCTGFVPAQDAELLRENDRLRKGNRILREEREVLKKAAMFFAA